MDTKTKLLAWLKKYDIWLIMLLALALRLIGYKWMDHPDFPEFYRDYYMVSHMMHGTLLVLLGPPSMQHGFHFGPFYYYLFAPLFALFKGNPFSLVLTGVIISVLTIYVFFKLLLLWFNDRNLSLTGAVFIAVSVYSVRLASYVSNPNFVPLFTLWFFYHLTIIAQKSTWLWDYVFLGLAFGLASQLHATATIVLPVVTALVLALSKYKLKIKTAAAFLSAVIFVYLPYLIYELTHSFENFRRLFILGAHDLHGGNLALSFLAIWNFIQGTLTPFNEWYTYTNIEPNILYLPIAILAALVLGLLVYRIFWPAGNKSPQVKISKTGRNIIWLWAIVGCTVLLLFNRAVHDHYLFVLWPLPLIFLTFGCFWLKSHFGVFKSALALFIIMSLLQVYSFYRLDHIPWSQFMPTYQSKYQNDPGVPEIGS